MANSKTNWTYTAEINIDGKRHSIVAHDKEGLEEPSSWEIDEIPGPTHSSKASFKGKLQYGSGFRSSEQWPYSPEDTANKVKQVLAKS